MSAEEELQLFIDVNGLSPKVAGLLRAASTAVQRVVLDQGSLATCRDPNAGCVGRIRKAERSAGGMRIITPSRDEVEAFIEENELNERAGEALRGALPAVQWHVLDQGNLRSCREPSAGCIGRISKAQKNLDPALLAIPHAEGPSEAEVEEFIQENDLDERASTSLRGSAQWVQRQVLDQGSLHSCRDRTAGLMGRLRRAEGATLGHAGRRKSSHAFSATAPQAQELEQFILDNGLNERAADALRSAGSTVQRQVLNQGSLHGTREPSAACIGRISKIQKNSLESWRPPSLDDVESFIYENRLDQRAAAALEGAPPMVQHSLLSQGPLRGNASRACMAQIRAATQDMHTAPSTTTVTSEVEQFILENGLDEAASNALHSASPVVQRHVLEQGSLTSCREPSAGCIGRIRKAELMYGKATNWAPEQGFNSAPLASQPDVESFIQKNYLNDRAAEALRGIPPEVQVEVMSQGSLATCRDPNAGCIGRIAKAQATFKHRPQKLILTERRALDGPSEEELNAFVQEHNLSERCVAILHDVPASVQRAVLDQGSLRGCRDPSAGCIGRVKKAQQALKDGMLQTPGRGAKRRYEEVSPAGGGLRREVDRFVTDHDLSERAAAVLREQRPAVQEMVLRGGSLRGTRDMSASCMGRIRKAQQELSDRSRSLDRGKRRRGY